MAAAAVDDMRFLDAGGHGIDRRGDLATLNLSDVPTVMVELGNLRAAHRTAAIRGEQYVAPKPALRTSASSCR